MCWDNPSTTYDQQNQCLSAWNTYVGGIDLNDPQLRDLVRQEDAYWGGLSYGEFVNLWNDNRRRPPASKTPNHAGNIASGSGSTALGISMVWPGPGPEDAVAGTVLVGGLCIAAIALVGAAIGVGTRALPQRQPMDWSIPRIQATAIAPPIPLDRDVPYPTSTPDLCSEEQMRARINGRSVAEVVGIAELQPQQRVVSKPIVVRYASRMCHGDVFPPITWFKGATLNTIHEGHRRYVASHLAGVLTPIEPEPLRDLSRAGENWPRTVTWLEVEWSEV